MNRKLHLNIVHIQTLFQNICQSSPLKLNVETSVSGIKQEWTTIIIMFGYVGLPYDSCCVCLYVSWRTYWKSFCLEFEVSSMKLLFFFSLPLFLFLLPFVSKTYFIHYANKVNSNVCWKFVNNFYLNLLNPFIFWNAIGCSSPEWEMFGREKRQWNTLCKQGKKNKKYGSEHTNIYNVVLIVNGLTLRSEKVGS